MDKLKPNLTGSAETMLQSFYARAQYSRGKKPVIYDAKALEIVERLDYDFSKAKKDSKMGKGVIARTLVLDELVQEFIDENPDCVVVNIACGLDTRFYRMDNGRITWYNLDLPETIYVRDQLHEEDGRVSTIAKSVLDETWPEDVTVRGKMLFIIEGLSMYLTAEENRQMLRIIHDNFENATVIMECIAKKWVNKEKVEESIQSTGAKFLFGADYFSDLGDVASGYRKVKDDNITRGAVKVIPIAKLVQHTKFLERMTQKILVFEKE